MGKIRVQDLSKMLGIPDQDLIFKLRSIGVRVEGKDAVVNTDVLKAVLEGRQLATPREVIVRDEESKATAPKRRPGLRRPPGPPPRRPRSVIQRVEPRIRTIPARETPVKPAEPVQQEPAAGEAAIAAATTAEVTTEAPTTVEAPPPEDTTTAATSPTAAAKVAPEVVVEEPRKSRRDRRREASQPGEEDAAAAVDRGTITVVEGMTVREFADKLELKSKDLIKRLVQRGIMANINHVLDSELAQELALDMGYDADIVTFEQEVQRRQEDQLDVEQPAGTEPRAPVVTIMGHVDHGKTTLLDCIRESRVVDSEHGGITQHIGAYHVKVNGQKIVFIDTPGHEAFTQLRARGAGVTDIVILVVAADDGVMPQTIEAIDHAKAAGVPLIVAVNKMDKSNANPDRVKQELSDRGLIPEEWGGDTVTTPMSALKNEGIAELLEMIVLTADLLELKGNPDLAAQGAVLEARKEVGRGTVATVLVQNGTVRIGDSFVSGATWGRVRSMTDDLGGRLDAAEPATPIEVTGFQDVPGAGDVFQVVGNESEARTIAEFRRQEQRRRELAPTAGRISLEQLFSKMEEGEVKELPVVLKADVQGSVEVLRETLEKLGTEKVSVKVLHAGVGAVTTNNVLLASASDAIVIGFNVRPERTASDLAETEGVEIRLYTVIYELTDDVKKAMVGLLEPEFKEVQKGTAEVRETFKVPKIGTIAGCHVVEGVIPRNGLARLLRDNVVVWEGRLASLRRFKDDVTEVRTGFDCGIGLERFQDIKHGDLIEVYVKEEVAQTL